MKKEFVFVFLTSLLLLTGCTNEKAISYLDVDDKVEVPKPDPEKPDPEKPDPEKPDPEKPDPEAPYKIPSAIASYYSSIDFSKDSQTVHTALTKLTKEKHTHRLSYNDLWEVLQATDLTPAGNEVYLLYGQKGILTGQTAYTRGKNTYGGRNGEWNREHTYARSLGTPNLEQSGTGANEDAHHIRPADVQWNAARGNKKFAQGSGASGNVSGGWYPGDEWKGDVARMMMYMYIRYQEQCLPSNVAVGERNAKDVRMINLLLQWNAEDPVSPLEIQRNEYLGKAAIQGNRNPFIDNPYLATQLWGGAAAENKWSK
ncbi:endonuclease I family protein [Myroides odoratus]|uniref:endonuclease I family protein n=1 Tax=Myroides odoratus TaxID=256 RepID=UPI0039B06A06